MQFNDLDLFVGIMYANATAANSFSSGFGESQIFLEDSITSLTVDIPRSLKIGNYDLSYK